MVADLCDVVLSCFRSEKAPRENSPNGDFFVLPHGDLSPRHTKVRHFSCVAFSPPVFRIFDWRGDLSPRQAKIRQTGAKTWKVATPKPAKWWFFRVFAWRPFAPPHESTRHSMRCVFGYCLSYLCLARRKVAMRKPDKIIFWRVFAWRPFAFSPRKHVYTTWHKLLLTHYWMCTVSCGNTGCVEKLFFISSQLTIHWKHKKAKKSKMVNIDVSKKQI